MTDGNGWFDLLPQVEMLIMERGVPVPGWRAGPEEKARFQASLARILAETRLVPDDARVVEAAGALARASTGLGLLEPLLSRPGVEEIIVRNGQVLLEERGKIHNLGRLADDAYFYRLAHRAADLSGRAMKADQPFVLVDLPNGSRLTAMIPPLSIEGTAINVRVFRREIMSLRDLVEVGAFEYPDREEGEHIPPDFEPDLPEIARFLAWMVHRNATTMLISGEFSSGKTTLLNALTACVQPTTMLSVVETFRELQVQHPFAARAVVPVPEKEHFPSLAEVVNVLYTRMRPDLIVFGEVVNGGEAAELLSAMNLGKKVMTTIHANSAYDALLRLESLARASGLPLQAIRERVGRGVDLVVHLKKDGARRYIREVVEVQGVGDDGRYRLHYLYGERGQK